MIYAQSRPSEAPAKRGNGDVVAKPTNIMISSDNLSPELGIFLDFVADDDRPTLVVEIRSRARLVYCNDALETLLEGQTHDSLPQWVDTLSDLLKDNVAKGSAALGFVGSFAGREWSSKKLGSAWFALFCKHESYDAVPRKSRNTGKGPEKCLKRDDSGYVKRYCREEFEERQRRDVEIRRILNEIEIEQQSSRDAEREELEKIMSSPESSASLSQNTQALNLNNKETLPELDELTVDWLQFPHLTSDPWIQFLTNHDWDKTAVGPMRTWSPVLRQMLAVIMSSMEPRVLYWGKELLMFYNEAATFLVGKMHPSPLGNKLADVWGVPIFNELSNVLRTGIERGKPVHNRRKEFVITRNGSPERGWFDFVFIPIPSPEGRFLGFVNEFNEITANVVQENRHDVFRSVLGNVANVRDLQGLWTAVIKALKGKSMDVTYALIYSLDNAQDPTGFDPNILPMEADSLHLQASFGIESHRLGSSLPPQLAKALQGFSEEIVSIHSGQDTFPPEMAVPVADVGTVCNICILPITSIDSRRLAFVILGMHPLRPLDETSTRFASSFRDLLFKSAALFSLPSEQRKIQEITSALSQQLQFVTSKAEKSEQNFTRMVHDAPIGMCMNRGDGHPIYVNDMYLELLGMSRSEFYRAAETGFAARDAIFEEDVQMVAYTWRTAMEQKSPGHLEFRVKDNTLSGEGVRWLEAITLQRCDESGNPQFLYGWLTDISARKLTESLVAERLQDALETKRASENFIDMVNLSVVSTFLLFADITFHLQVSHEIRNPLSSVLQLADNVLMWLPTITDDTQDSILSAEARASLADAAQTITLCAKHQKNIIDEVLTFSKLDSKLLVLAPERVQAPTIVQSALKMVKAELEHADIQGSVVIQQSYIDLAVDYVLMDPGRLLQVIINLLTNAIKFTQNSKLRQITIKLAASRTRPTQDECKVTLIAPRRVESDKSIKSVPVYQGEVGEEIFLSFSVEDTGCGLTDEEMKHLFHRFAQASPKTYKNYGGSGSYSLIISTYDLTS